MSESVSCQVFKPWSRKGGTTNEKVLSCFKLVFFQGFYKWHLVRFSTLPRRYRWGNYQLVLLKLGNGGLIKGEEYACRVSTFYQKVIATELMITQRWPSSRKAQLSSSRTHEESGASIPSHSIDSGDKVIFPASS